jgi:hypothetical protein
MGADPKSSVLERSALGPTMWWGSQHRSTDHPYLMCLSVERAAPREGVGPAKLAGGPPASPRSR